MPKDEDLIRPDPDAPVGMRNPFSPESDAPEGYYPLLNEYRARLARALLRFVERGAYDKDAPPEVVRAFPDAARVLANIMGL